MSDLQKEVIDLKKELKELDDHHVVDKLKLLKHINDNATADIEPLVEGYVKENMLRIWQSIGERAEDKTMQTLVKILWEQMCKGAGFEFDIDEKKESIQIKCTYCPYVDLAKEANSLEMGYQMFCASDPYIVDGFNSKIGFKRTKTLMEGHDCCDHFYYMK